MTKRKKKTDIKHFTLVIYRTALWSKYTVRNVFVFVCLLNGLLRVSVLRFLCARVHRHISRY